MSAIKALLQESCQFVNVGRVALTNGDTVQRMAHDDDIAREIQRQAKEQVPERTRIEIPDGLTEDEAVASVIAQYKSMTGVEIPDADARAEVRKKYD